jgi:hypothetical protein
MKLCTAVQEGCGYKDTLHVHRYFAPLAKYFTVCITYQPAYVICCANSGQTKTDHLKFRVELVQALLFEHPNESVRKFQGHHSTDKNVPRLVERHFPERIPPTEKKARPKERCVVCYKNNRRKEGDSVLVPRI